MSGVGVVTHGRGCGSVAAAEQPELFSVSLSLPVSASSLLQIRQVMGIRSRSTQITL